MPTLEEVPMEEALRRFPLSDDTKKEIERIRKCPEFKLIVYQAIVEELSKPKAETQDDKLESYYASRAYAKLLLTK